MEVQRGSVLSEALPLLVLPCPAAVAEVRQLEASDAGAPSGWGLGLLSRQDCIQLPCRPKPCCFAARCSYSLEPLCNARSPCPRLPTHSACCSHNPSPLLAGISNVACFLRDIGVVVQFLSRHQLAAQSRPTPRYDAALRHCIAGMARRLVAAAAARGWSALAALLQPATAACEGKEHQTA